MVIYIYFLNLFLNLLNLNFFNFFLNFIIVINTTSTKEDIKFTTSLRNLGPVDPSSSFPPPLFPPLPPSERQQQDSPTSSSSFHANNAALRILAARERIAADAQLQAVAEGAGDKGGKGRGREYLPVGLLRMVLGMRDDRRWQGKEIESRLGLKKGVVERLGGKGVVSLVGGDDGRGGGGISK